MNDNSPWDPNEYQGKRQDQAGFSGGIASLAFLLLAAAVLAGEIGYPLYLFWQSLP